MIETHTDTLYAGPDADPDAPADIFIEIPHGATEQAHLEAAAALGVVTPPDWDVVFWCSTDQGAPEVGARAAQMLTDPEWVTQHMGPALGAEAASRSVRLVRGIIPRHLADLNRRWASEDEIERGDLTAVVPDFMREQREAIARLGELHARYHDVVEDCYMSCCDRGGFAVQLHTFSPRSVSAPGGVITGKVLRHAWSAEQREQWPKRPDGQLITARAGEPSLIDEAIVEAFLESFADEGVELAVNEPFSLHPIAVIDDWSHRWPGQIIGLEIGRAVLAIDYDPLAQWEPDPDVVERMAAALARVLATSVLTEAE